MALVTATTLITRVRNRADMVNSNFVADAEMYQYLNEGVQKLHEKLVDAYGDEYIASEHWLESFATDPFTAEPSTTDLVLPSDFFKLYEVNLWPGSTPGPIGGDCQTLLPFNAMERNTIRREFVSMHRYRVMYGGDASPFLRILPAPTSAVTIRYAPVRALIASGSSEVNFINGWERYVVLYTAIQCLNKEESDTRTQQGELAKMEAELEAIKHDIDAGSPKSAVDMAAVNDFWVW